ncbi:MAG TPA: molybdate ABC transporter permease subunit [Gaiellaceae bacterium]|nr:molybdate ABC transporter permease subunit [Gaiellaceae bacterium]
MKLLFGAAATVALTFLALPVLAIFLRVSPTTLVHELSDPVARDALVVSLRTSALAQVLVVVLGTPTAYLLATRRFRGRNVLLTVVELPLVLPPAVAGIGLLAAFGRTGLLSTSIPFTQLAVVLAIAFVSAPFFVRTAVASFEAVDPTLVAAARTLGAGPWRVFLRIALPLAASGLGAGLALSFARGLGEFGATIMFAGSLQRLTQTLSLAIYAEFARNFDVALAMGALLVAFSFILLLVVKWLSFGWTLPFRSVPASSG